MAGYTDDIKTCHSSLLVCQHSRDRNPWGRGGHHGHRDGQAEGVPRAGGHLPEAPAQTDGEAAQVNLQQDAPGQQALTGRDISAQEGND